MTKYWDIIPPKKSKKSGQMDKLIKEIKKREKENKIPILHRAPYTKVIPNKPSSPCLHDNCPQCHGTGIGLIGTCIHMVSCPCPKCTPTMLQQSTGTDWKVGIDVAKGSNKNIEATMEGDKALCLLN